MELRTPSFTYNHGGYYAPSDPELCNNPGGICGNCQDRIDAYTLLSLKCCENRPDFLEPCPSCGNQESYVTHALPICNGCEDKICTMCYNGARYCCAILYPRPPPVSRQCSEEKWRVAEEFLQSNPLEMRAVADCEPGRHLYVVIRTGMGDIERHHICSTRHDESIVRE